METPELERKIFDALIFNAELMELLPNGAESIYHQVAPSVQPNKYPLIVYAVISDVPSLSGDDKEIAHRVTIRLHVITAERNTIIERNKFAKVCGLIKQIMTGLNFRRLQTTPYIEDGKAMLIFDFVKGVEA